MRIRKGRIFDTVPMRCRLNQSPWDIIFQDNVSSSAAPPPPRHVAGVNPPPLLPPPPPPPLLSPFPLPLFDPVTGKWSFFAKRTAANVVGADESTDKKTKKQKKSGADSSTGDRGGAVDEAVANVKEEDGELVLCPKTGNVDGDSSNGDRGGADDGEAVVKFKEEDGELVLCPKTGSVDGDSSNGDCGGADVVKFEEDDGDLVLCPKMGKKGWQCGAVVRKGNSFCDNHLSATSGKRASSRRPVPVFSGEICYYGFGTRLG